MDVQINCLFLLLWFIEPIVFVIPDDTFYKFLSFLDSFPESVNLF